jgi:proteasome lid subunit RPN8/RPN11
MSNILTIEQQISKVAIRASALATIKRHGEEAFPNECCGFLYGSEADGRSVELAVPVANSKEGDQRRRFEISPLEYMKAERFALENNTQLLGVYHSHPNCPAIASEHDLAQAMPYFSYVIVSVVEGETAELRSWKLKDDARVFLEERVL